MFGISFAELVIIFLLVLIVMGPEKLPEVARWAGKGMRELRKATNTLRNTLEAEDFEGTRSATRNIGADQSPKPSAGSGQSPSASADSATSQSRSTSTSLAQPDDGPPANLDQIDDADFDQMLQQQLQNRGDNTAMYDAELPPVGDAADTFEVALPPTDSGDIDALYDIALVTPSAEAA